MFAIGRMTLVFITICSLAVLALAVAALLSRRKKFKLQPVQLIGFMGEVHSILDPEGTVLLDGEIWRACSSDDRSIGLGTRIEVVGSRQHLLMVREIQVSSI